MPRPVRTAALAALLPVLRGACDTPRSAPVGVDEPDPELVFVRPYRGPSDTCQLTGESAFTVDFLDDSADLVSCLTGSADSASLAAQPNARGVAQTESFTLYSVAVR